MRGASWPTLIDATEKAKSKIKSERMQKTSVGFAP
jgi:hypothetical protein